MKRKQILGAKFILSSLGLAWYFYGWVLSLIIFLEIVGNNMCQSPRYGEKNKEVWRSGSRPALGPLKGRLARSQSRII